MHYQQTLPIIERQARTHFILNTPDNRYFQSTPARARLTLCRDAAREFDSEMLADAFRTT
jgi:hypothetical protein